MLAPETDLFACGHKVYIPSPGTPSERKDRHVSAAAIRESPLKTSKQLSPLNNHLKELGRSLSFNDDVVTEISPHLLSYAKSKELVGRSLFRPSTIGIKTRTRPTNTLTGRHNCRGDMKRHVPCNLAGVLDNTEQTNGMQLLPYNLGTVPSPPSPTKPASNIFATVAGYGIKGLDTGTSENVITEGSRKRLWQKNSIPSQSLFSERMESPPLRDYLSELQDGARPVHQKMADRTELVLDNGAKFEAVVQESFPRSPREWCAPHGKAVKKEKKITNVRGYQKWLDFPQPAKVRK